MNTKTPLALAAAALILVATTACNRNDDANGGTNNTPAADATAANDTTMSPTGPAVPAGTDSTVGAPTQAEALSLVNVVNDHEIKSSEMAKSKNVTGPVLEYANMMTAEHGKNMTMTTELLGKTGGAPSDTARVTDMRAKGEAKRSQLTSLTGDAFAKAYIDQMVMDHQETLTALDGMMPAATDEAVKAHMTMTRQHVQMHLDRAKQIQGTMGGAAAGAAGTGAAAGTTTGAAAAAGGTAPTGG